MGFVELIAVLAALQLLFFGTQVAKARDVAGLKAPAMTGDERFERMNRVQMNTIEVLMLFYPALFIAGQHWSAWIVAPLGAIYLVGRLVYWQSYLRDPSTRTKGFMLSIAPTGVLLVLALIGSIWSIFQ